MEVDFIGGVPTAEAAEVTFASGVEVTVRGEHKRVLRLEMLGALGHWGPGPRVGEGGLGAHAASGLNYGKSVRVSGLRQTHSIA